MPVPQSLPAGREIRGSLGNVSSGGTGCKRVSRKKREILTGMSCLETVSIRSSRILMSDYCVLDRRRHQAQAPRLRWPAGGYGPKTASTRTPPVGTGVWGSSEDGRLRFGRPGAPPAGGTVGAPGRREPPTGGRSWRQPRLPSRTCSLGGMMHAVPFLKPISHCTLGDKSPSHPGWAIRSPASRGFAPFLGHPG